MSGEEQGLLPIQFIEKLRSRFAALDIEGRGTLDREQLTGMIDENHVVSADAVYEQMEHNEEGAFLGVQFHAPNSANSPPFGRNNYYELLKSNLLLY